MKYARPAKAVIAAAGFGTRFLPQTKAMPKEMLPVVDKPIIQYVVEELVEAGIKDIIIVTGYSKRAIEDHFDTPNAELSAVLQNNGKQAMLDSLHEISNMANFVFVRQKQLLGNAAPLLYARHLINNEPFVYTWADEFVQASPSRMQQAIEVHQKTGGSVFSCIRATKDSDYDRYGIIDGEPVGKNTLRMSKVVEKPGKAEAPSDLASVGGYVLTSEILPYIERIAAEHDGQDELKIQTAIQLMIDDGHAYYAHEVADGRYFDAGDKLEYIKTVIEVGLQRKDIGKELRQYIKSLQKSL